MTGAHANRRCCWEWIAPVLVLAAVGVYYLWQVRASGTPFYWHYDLGGYYDYLGRGFASGHLYVPIQPSPELLRLPNPWDPAVPENLKMQDMALYSGRYYLYFGAAPAVLLFWPWRVATGHDLPENFALFLLCFGGFLFSAAALVRLLVQAGIPLRGPLLAVLFAALGLCQSIPYLLNRPAVYEIAIASGYFFVSAGVLAMTAGTRRPGIWMLVCGLMFGCAMASRPHLALPAVLVALFLQKRHGLLSARLAGFAAGFLAVAFAVGIYNLERFGAPWEFGFRYQLAGPGQNEVGVAAKNVIPGLYFMLFRPPDFSAVFPWVRIIFRHSYEPLERLPLPYFYEPTIGALWAAPFLLAGFSLARRFSGKPPVAEAFRMLRIAGGCAAVVVLFLTSTHLVAQRYEADFVPLAVFAAVGAIAIRRSFARSTARRVMDVLLLVLVGYSIVANVALGLAGPYDDLLDRRPAAFVRLARGFSPLDRYRPLLNPGIRLAFDARLPPVPTGLREPLVHIGQGRHGWSLSLTPVPGGIRLISQTKDSESYFDLSPPPEVARFRVEYAPDAGLLTVALNGRTIFRQPAPTLVTARDQVTIGEDRSGSGINSPRFSGRIVVLERSILPRD